MDDLKLKKIKQFLESDRWGLGKRVIQRNTRIEQDLKLTGDDAIEFIVSFGEEFGVNVSNFMAADYFEGEGIFPFLKVINSLLCAKKKSHKKVLTIGDLERAIELGELR